MMWWQWGKILRGEMSFSSFVWGDLVLARKSRGKASTERGFCPFAQFLCLIMEGTELDSLHPTLLCIGSPLLSSNLRQPGQTKTATVTRGHWSQGMPCFLSQRSYCCWQTKLLRLNVTETLSSPRVCMEISRCVFGFGTLESWLCTTRPPWLSFLWRSSSGLVSFFGCKIEFPNEGTWTSPCEGLLVLLHV